MAEATTDFLIFTLENAYRARSFQGTTTAGALRGIEPAMAIWQPYEGAHSIWELLLHIGYWKYAARRHLVGHKVSRFPRSPSNFPAVPPDADEAALREDRKLVDNEHELLLEAVRGFDPERLTDKPKPRAPTFAQLIVGVAAHDTHHTGKIQLLKRMYAAH